jgi:hypothetical protein
VVGKTTRFVIISMTRSNLFFYRKAYETQHNVTQKEKNMLLGGFLFLRYISPAIISPEVFGVLEPETKVTEHQRRTLILVKQLFWSHFFPLLDRKSDSKLGE